MNIWFIGCRRSWCLQISPSKMLYPKLENWQLKCIKTVKCFKETWRTDYPNIEVGQDYNFCSLNWEYLYRFVADTNLNCFTFYEGLETVLTLQNNWTEHSLWWLIGVKQFSKLILQQWNRLLWRAEIHLNTNSQLWEMVGSNLKHTWFVVNGLTHSELLVL